MGMGSTSTSQTQQTTLPSWLTEGQQNLVGQSQNMLGPFMNVPGYRVAGFTPDQTGAFDLTRSMAMNAFQNPLQQVNPMGAQSNAAQVTGSAIQQGMNPYIQSVVDTTMNDLNRQKGQEEADIGARAAAAGAFGGSREAVQRSLLDKNFNNTAASTIAQLMSQGYSQSQAQALANAQMQQQSSLFNAQAAMQVPQINSQLFSAQQNQQMNALNALLGTGGAEQQLAQQNLNVPFTTLQMLSNILGPTLNNTDKTVQTNGTSSGQGGAMQAVGLVGSLLCHCAGTLIRLEDGSFKPVEELDIGDKTMLGGKVIGNGKVMASDIYEYRGTKLNGRHAVFENGRFVRVEDSPLAKEQDMDGAMVYPIVTENHLLVTESYICADLVEKDEDIGAEGRLAELNKDKKRLALLMVADRTLWPHEAAA